MVADNFFCCFRSCHVDFHTCHFASQSHNCKRTTKLYIHMCSSQISSRSMSLSVFFVHTPSQFWPILQSDCRKPSTPPADTFEECGWFDNPSTGAVSEKKPKAYAVSCFRHHIRPRDPIRKKNTAVARVQCLLMTVAFPFIPASETYSAKTFQPKM